MCFFWHKSKSWLCIRDPIVGNNHNAISYWAISRYHNMATIWQRCLHSIKWWLYGCRTCTVYVTIMQLYNHRLTTWALNVDTCSTRLRETNQLPLPGWHKCSIKHGDWRFVSTALPCSPIWYIGLHGFAQAAVIENTWLYLLCLWVSSAGLMLPTPPEN